MTTRLDVGPLLETVDQFVSDAEERLFGGEMPDGDLDVVEELLLEARSIGLLADPDPESDTGRFGVWGRHVETEGVGLSLAVLRRLGRVCAGLATAVHAQGLGTMLLGPGGRPPGASEGSRLVAAFSPPSGVALDPRTFGDGMLLTDRRLRGTARYALAAGRGGPLGVGGSHRTRGRRRLDGAGPAGEDEGSAARADRTANRVARHAAWSTRSQTTWPYHRRRRATEASPPSGACR